MAVVPGQCGTCTTPAVALFLEAVLPGEFSLTGSGSGQWVDTPLALVLPEAGDWRVTADVRGQVNVSLTGNASVVVRLAVDGAPALHSERLVARQTTNGLDLLGAASGNGATASLATFVTTTGPATLVVQACRVYSGTNPVARLDSDGNGRSTLTAERVR
jgi:hypothetical protein